MPKLKSIPMHCIPLRVLFIFRQMYRREVKPSIRAQVIHGIYLSYLCSLCAAWYYVILLHANGIFNNDYYTVIYLYFMSIYVVSFMLNIKLRKILGLRNPLEKCKISFLCTDASVQELGESLADCSIGKVYRPAVRCASGELISLFFKISDCSKHKLYILKYVNKDADVEVLHIVDSTLTKKLHVFFNEETSEIEVS